MKIKTLNVPQIQLNVFHKYLIAFFMSLIIGVNLFMRSDFPPFGAPLNEISDQYWPIMVDIARIWRTFDFSFWRHEVAGGLNLFVTGQYPILNPMNFLAWFLNDDAFFLEKMIEPYVFGFFLMTVLLWDVFKTRWYVAMFGGLAYMGLLLCKMTPQIQSPYFLYGCSLFPGMILVMIKLKQRHVYLASLGIGAMLALQFLMEGVTQLPQMTIWWGIFSCMYFGWRVSRESSPQERWNLARQWVISVFIFVIAVYGLGAVQMVPSIHYFQHESGREAGYYGINNFDLFKPGNNNAHSLMNVLWEGLVKFGHPRMKIFLGLFIGCLAIALANWGRVFARLQEGRLVYLLWATTIIFFLIPNTALLLSQIFPVLEAVFKPLTYFSFHYALHTLDFCMILTCCLIVNDEKLTIWGDPSWVKRFLGSITLVLAFGVGLLPILVHSFPHITGIADWFKYFDPEKANTGVKILTRIWIILFFLAFRPRHIITHGVLAFILLGSGFMATYECFKWYDKGCRTAIEQYQFDTPEHQYYKNAGGKYIMPHKKMVPAWVVNDFNLLNGVYGSSGLIASAPRRVIKFVHYYNHRHEAVPAKFKGGASRLMYFEEDIPSSFTTYFPIDFTLVVKTADFRWKDFKKVVSGKEFDVYERINSTPSVYFANKVQVLDLWDLVRKYDEDRSTTVYVEANDAELVKRIEASGGQGQQPVVHDFTLKDGGARSFEVKSDSGTFVVVPERYASGWKVWVDGKKTDYFPANYLFIGFHIPSGIHHIKMSYDTPWLFLGVFVNILVVCGGLALIRRYGVAQK